MKVSFGSTFVIKVFIKTLFIILYISGQVKF